MSENATLGYLNPVSGEYRAFPEEVNTLHDVREYLGVASKDPDALDGMVPAGRIESLTFSDLQHDPATAMLVSAREKSDNDVRGFIRMPAPPLDIFILDEGEWNKHGSVDFGWTFATSTQAEYGNAFRSVVIPDQVLADSAHFLDKSIAFPARNPDGSLIPVILERVPEIGHEPVSGPFACKDPCMALAICQEWGMFDGREFITPGTAAMPEGMDWKEILEKECFMIDDHEYSVNYVLRDGSTIMFRHAPYKEPYWRIDVHRECAQALGPIDYPSSGHSKFDLAVKASGLVNLQFDFIDAGSPERAPEPPLGSYFLNERNVEILNRPEVGEILTALVNGDIGGIHLPPGTDRGITRTLKEHLAKPSARAALGRSGPMLPTYAALFFDAHAPDIALYPDGTGRDRFREALAGIGDVRLRRLKGRYFRWEFPDGSAIVDNGAHVGLGVCEQNLLSAEECIRDAESTYICNPHDPTEPQSWAEMEDFPGPLYAIPDLLKLPFPAVVHSEYSELMPSHENDFDMDWRLLGLEFPHDVREYADHILSMDYAGMPVPTPQFNRIAGHHGINDMDGPSAKIDLVITKDSGWGLEARTCADPDEKKEEEMLGTEVRVELWRGGPLTLYDDDARGIFYKI